MQHKTPVHMKLLAGTQRNDRPEYEGSLPEVQGYEEVPPPPLWLTAIAVQEYMRLAPLLIKSKLLNEGTMSAFCQMCALHGKIVQQYMADMVPPMSWISNLRNLHGDFGLNPHAARKLDKGLKPDAQDKPANKFGNRGKREE